MTSGGNESLAPPDIPIGTVSKVERRSGSAGPLLQIDVSADLERLNFVNVVFYRPLAEVDPSEVAD
jgi:rod shape-determining protein MreC